MGEKVEAFLKTVIIFSTFNEILIISPRFNLAKNFTLVDAFIIISLRRCYRRTSPEATGAQRDDNFTKSELILFLKFFRTKKLAHLILRCPVHMNLVQ